MYENYVVRNTFINCFYFSTVGIVCIINTLEAVYPSPYNTNTRNLCNYLTLGVN